MINNLDTEGLSVHFHGMRQQDNPWMDGVPYVHQCPTMPHTHFVYRFKATPAGTHWYHSHFKSQRLDGLHGLFIVHKKIPDIPEFHLKVIDWYHVSSVTLEVTSPYNRQHAGSGVHEMKNHGAQNVLLYGEDAVPSYYDSKTTSNPAPSSEHNQRRKRDVNIQREKRGVHDGDEMDDDSSTSHSGTMDMTEHDEHGMHGMSGHMKHGVSPYSDVANTVYKISGLINGRGRYDSRKLPLSTFRVKQGLKYRFRIANTGAHLSFRISIDKHKLTLVASDGFDLKPKEYDYVMVFPGESMDFEMKANQKKGQYWLRALGGHGGHNVPVSAIVSYSDSSEDPVSTATPCTFKSKCQSFNCPKDAYPTHEHIQCTSIDMARSLNDDENRHYYASQANEEITEIFINLGFNFGPSMNSMKFMMPSTPMHQIYDNGVVKCSDEVCKTGCECTNIQSIPYNKTIQMIFSNYDPEEHGTVFGHHSTHLHGHSFAVLKLGYPKIDPDTGELTPNHDVDCRDKYCYKPTWRHYPTDLNHHNPPLKDTVIVPSLGYAVIRFRSDNPGYWLLHCHIDPHSNGGMTLLVEEAREHIRSPPEDFPKCRNFDWSATDYNDYKGKTGKLVDVNKQDGE